MAWPVCRGSPKRFVSVLATLLVVAIGVDFVALAHEQLPLAFSIRPDTRLFPGPPIREIVNVTAGLGYACLMRGYGVIEGYEPMLGYRRDAQRSAEEGTSRVSGRVLDGSGSYRTCRLESKSPSISGRAGRGGLYQPESGILVVVQRPSGFRETRVRRDAGPFSRGLTPPVASSCEFIPLVCTWASACRSSAGPCLPRRGWADRAPPS